MESGWIGILTIRWMFGLRIRRASRGGARRGQTAMHVARTRPDYRVVVPRLACSHYRSPLGPYHRSGRVPEGGQFLRPIPEKHRIAWAARTELSVRATPVLPIERVSIPELAPAAVTLAGNPALQTAPGGAFSYRRRTEKQGREVVKLHARRPEVPKRLRMSPALTPITRSSRHDSPVATIGLPLGHTIKAVECPTADRCCKEY
jgi:hypothetical protein